MSVLKADTIQSTGGGAATLTKQEAVKHWVNYDAVDGATDGSLNQSSLTDHATGEFSSNYTNNFSSATDKCHFASVINSTNGGGAREAGANRGGVMANIGHIESDTNANALATSQVQFYTAFGSTASADGAADDLSASYCTSIGDLA
jgi:hypothetical protein